MGNKIKQSFPALFDDKIAINYNQNLLTIREKTNEVAQEIQSQDSQSIGEDNVIGRTNIINVYDEMTDRIQVPPDPAEDIKLLYY